MVLNKLLVRTSPYQFFLVDSIGALLSVVAGLLVSQFENIFGIPPQIMYTLSGIAGCLALYSFLCSMLKPVNWQSWLKGVAVANFLYCGITAGLIIYLHKQITGFGIAFFIGEIVIIAVLALLEFKKSLIKIR